MFRYYTRACNFYYGNRSLKLVNKKKTLPLCQKKEISFDQIEIITRSKNKVTYKLLHIKKLNGLNRNQKKK